MAAQGRDRSQMSTIQRQIQQDWANREYIEVITCSIKKIADFLNSFGLYFLIFYPKIAPVLHCLFWTSPGWLAVMVDESNLRFQSLIMSAKSIISSVYKLAKNSS